MAYMGALPESPRTSNMVYVDCPNCDAHCILFNAISEPIYGDDSISNTLVVSVRGTTSAVDILCDLDVLQCPMDDGVVDYQQQVLVHAGFHRQFKALIRGADGRISSHMADGGTLVCTGHSLGAGVAALFAVSYGSRFPGRVSYMGFGSPRQGNQAFSDMMRSATTLAVRVKNLRDPVCALLPAVCLPSRYAFAGVEVAIGDDPCPDVPNLVFLGDHDIVEYITNLTNDRDDTNPLQRLLWQLTNFFTNFRNSSAR